MPKKKKKSRNSTGNGNGTTTTLSSPSATANTTTSRFQQDAAVHQSQQHSIQNQQPQQPQQSLNNPTIQIVDCMTLQAVKVSSSSSNDNNRKSLKYTPTIVLTVQDAQCLDVHHGDDIFIIVVNDTDEDDDNENENNTEKNKARKKIRNIAIASVRIIASNESSTTTPTTNRRKSTGGSNSSSGSKIKPEELKEGCCGLFPSVFFDSFVNVHHHQSPEHSSSSNNNNHNPSSSRNDTNDDENNNSNKLLMTPQSTAVTSHSVTPSSGIAAATTTATTTTTTTTPYSSTSKSKFSFARGGGGDTIISPTSTSRTPTTTPSRNNNNRSKTSTKKVVNVSIIPFDSDAGDILQSMLCRSASTVSVSQVRKLSFNNEEENNATNNNDDNITVESGVLLKRLLLAYTMNCYLSPTTTNIIPMSYRGQSIQMHVMSCMSSSLKVRSTTARQAVEQTTINDDSDRRGTTQVDNGSSKKDDDDDDNNVLKQMERLSLYDKATMDDTTTAIIQAIEETLKQSSTQPTEDSTSFLQYKVTRETRFVVVSANQTADAVDQIDSRLQYTTVTEAVSNGKDNPPKKFVAGLNSTLEQIYSALETPLKYPELFQSKVLNAPKGVLLHGPSGCGKTSLARQVAQMFMDEENIDSTHPTYHVEWIQCATLQSRSSFVGEAETALVQRFENASLPRAGKAGCLLILDDIHLICPRRTGTDPGTDRLSSTLLALLDGIDNKTTTTIGSTMTGSSSYPVVILAITANPGALDPALRRPGRLDTEIEVPIPDEPTLRSEILRHRLESLGTDITEIGEDQWLSMARLAKGFLGVDLMLAAKEAVRRKLLSNSGDRLDGRIRVDVDVVESAIRSVKPSAIKAVSVEIPKVPWSSIGGMERVKSELRDAVSSSLTHSEVFQRLGIRPPKGVLLYGPPGCSKTLMARALATEGQMNFLAVKGPELLSKWLGESERALAALFRRARLASPSIIFFDEVDAIASKRGGGGGGGDRLLSQLLTELDGIQTGGNATGTTRGGGRVVIVCATNRPDLLDGALMRPGRIDRMIYVGVPDQHSRKRILEIGLKGKACSDDVDIDALASDDISGGLSGAEMVASCRDAALLAMEEYEELGNTISTSPSITMRNLSRALTNMERQITPSMLEFYASYSSGKQ